MKDRITIEVNIHKDRHDQVKADIRRLLNNYPWVEKIHED